MPGGLGLGLPHERAHCQGETHAQVSRLGELVECFASCVEFYERSVKSVLVRSFDMLAGNL